MKKDKSKKFKNNGRGEVDKTILYRPDFRGEGGEAERVEVVNKKEKKPEAGIFHKIARILMGFSSKKKTNQGSSISDNKTKSTTTPILVKVKKPVFSFDIKERKIFVNKGSENTVFLTHFFPVITEGEMVHVYFANERERNFPTSKDIVENLKNKSSHGNPFYCEAENLMAAQLEFIKICQKNKMRSDKAFIKYCLEKELKLSESGEEGVQRTSIFQDEVVLLREDICLFNCLGILFVNQSEFNGFFEKDLIYNKAVSALDDFFGTLLEAYYGEIPLDIETYKSRYGELPSGKIFSGVENIFYAVDQIEEKLNELQNSLTELIKLLPYKGKNLIEEDHKRFSKILQEELILTKEIVVALGDWRAIQRGFAYDVDIENPVLFPGCPRLHQEIICGSNGHRYEKDFCCCDDKGVVNGHCHLNVTDKPDYCDHPDYK